MNAATSNRSYYPALDGLRGIAIILVLCCHHFNFIPFMEFGWVGVDLFFVLSGFLITDILLRSRKEKNYFSGFYIRRILRIFPLYYGALLVYFFAAPFFSTLASQYAYYHNNQWLSWFHLQNWLYISNEKPGNFLLLNHFWSLSVEEQFYLVWPVVVYFIRDTKWLARFLFAVLALCILARLASWIYFGNSYTNFYFQYMTRVDGLCIGSLIACWRMAVPQHAKRNMIRLVATLLGVQLLALACAKTWAGGFPHFQVVGYSSVAVLMGLLVFYVTGPRIPALLQWPFLKKTGKISYGLYVYHWPILVLFKLFVLARLVAWGFSENAAYITVSMVALLLAAVVANASYIFFEKKMLDLKDVATREGAVAAIRKRIALFFRPASSRQP